MHNKPPISTKLSHAYTNMLEHVKNALQKMDEATQETKLEQRLEHAFADAKQVSVHLGELTQEEAELLSTYLKRDIQDAAQSLNESGKVLGDWLAFDWRLVEKRLWKLFSQVADKTQLQELKFQQQLQASTTYRSGEVTGPGSLQCVKCNHITHFYQPSEIPICQQCQSTEFVRKK